MNVYFLFSNNISKINVEKKTSNKKHIFKNQNTKSFFKNYDHNKKGLNLN